MNVTPSYWWDFDHNSDTVIVQSDQPNGLLLARCNTVEQAEAVIADLAAGRISKSELTMMRHNAKAQL